jgi:hypothetical protein
MKSEKTNVSTTAGSSVKERRLGADELNLAEFPLAVFSHRIDPSRKTAEFEDEIFDEGSKRTVRRRLVISGSDRFGLPMSQDTDVLLVLIQLTKQRTNFETRALTFSRYELIELLRWNHSGTSYRRLDDTLQRWVSTTLYYNHAWWDRAVRRWKSKSFHVIETLDLKGRDQDEPDDSQCSLLWNEVLFQSFQSSNLKALDLDAYFELKRPAARQAYRFLDKRFWCTSRLEFDLRLFACEHVGLSREYDSANLKRALEPVLKELESIGLLQPMPLKERYLRQGPGEYKVVLVRQKCRAEKENPALAGTLAQELTSRGVWADLAPSLAEALPEAEIRRYIELHDWLLGRGDKRISRNPAGFLAASIASRFPLPKDFPGRAEAPKSTPPSRVTTSVSDPRRETGEVTELEKSIFRLTDDERRSLEAEAVRQAEPFVAATYERLKQAGGSLFNEVRKDILLKHLKRRGVEYQGEELELKQATA